MRDRKSGSAGMPRPISYAVFCLKKKDCWRRRWWPGGAKWACCRLSRTTPALFFFNDTATTEIYTLSLHDALPIFSDISDESKNYLDKAGITTACLRIKSKWTAGGK